MLYFQAEFVEPAYKSILSLNYEDGKCLGAMVHNPNGAVGFLGLQDCPILKMAYDSGSQFYLTLQYEIENNHMFVIGGVLSDTKLSDSSIQVILKNFNPMEHI